MSTMSSNISAAMSSLWDFAADSGTFTPYQGQAVNLQVKIISEEFKEMDDFNPGVSGLSLRAKALTSALGSVPVGKTQNREGDKFAVGGVTYEVIEVVERDSCFTTCVVREVS